MIFVFLVFLAPTLPSSPILSLQGWPSNLGEEMGRGGTGLGLRPRGFLERVSMEWCHLRWCHGGKRGKLKMLASWLTRVCVRTWIGSKPGSKEEREQQKCLRHGTGTDGSSLIAAGR